MLCAHDDADRSRCVRTKRENLVRCDDVGGKTDTKFFRIGGVTKQDSRSETGEGAGKAVVILLVFGGAGVIVENGEGGEAAETKQILGDWKFHLRKSVHFCSEI